MLKGKGKIREGKGREGKGACLLRVKSARQREERGEESRPKRRGQR